MGLDSFWYMPDNSEPTVKFDPPIHLCGGIFSEFGQGSFRGKVYDETIEDATGVSLYQQRIDNKTVREMAVALEGRDYETVRRGCHEITAEEYADLRRMFRTYADAGADLVGWW